MSLPDFSPVFIVWPFFMVGLLNGWHCVGMCGGIVGALTAGSAPKLSLHLAYNSGRILSYVLVGALAGAAGSGSMILAEGFPLRLLLFIFANCLILLMGAYLLGAGRALIWLERPGQKLWRSIQPLGRRFIPARHIGQALALGLVWGWLPCGLVYVALASALASGSSAMGASIMLAFALGTLPNLLFAAFMLTRLKTWTHHPLFRKVAGLLLLAYALYGFYSAWRMGAF
ncbi:MAG: sulfite exporter TauE/SafE family protein [Zoogloeaceae bacterium]|jgi:sulfite exporter TauE/SafE|nr:sulfite exporter TauE/SafE family protein [Zoogloeaceae bacterium]